MAIASNKLSRTRNAAERSFSTLPDHPPTSESALDPSLEHGATEPPTLTIWCNQSGDTDGLYDQWNRSHRRYPCARRLRRQAPDQLPRRISLVPSCTVSATTLSSISSAAELLQGGRLGQGADSRPRLNCERASAPTMIEEVRFAADSALEGRVTSEPVSETGFSGPRNYGLIPRRFVEDIESIRASYRAGIGRNFGLCPWAAFPAMSG